MAGQQGVPCADRAACCGSAGTPWPCWQQGCRGFQKFHDAPRRRSNRRMTRQQEGPRAKQATCCCDIPGCAFTGGSWLVPSEALCFRRCDSSSLVKGPHACAAYQWPRQRVLERSLLSAHSRGLVWALKGRMHVQTTPPPRGHSPIHPNSHTQTQTLRMPAQALSRHGNAA